MELARTATACAGKTALKRLVLLFYLQSATEIIGFTFAQVQSALIYKIASFFSSFNVRHESIYFT